MDYSTRGRMNDVAMLLRDHPPATTADVSDYCALYWDGKKLYGVHLSPDEPGEIDELFDAASVFDEIPAAVDEWLQSPKYSLRPTLLEWIKEAPPIESGE